MVEEAIIATIKSYLAILTNAGIHAQQAVLFGSFARGEGHADSDIDVIIIAPEFDQKPSLELIKTLWRLRGNADDRIEPIPCGQIEWQTDQKRPILEIARQEGITIAA
ncbi:MAG: nucleotidyltransferase domain-containing protein [Sedimentisphaerales bacterium]|nr:nucleotidyltransferase domain-containing protein [Sedimentisphaerales bacterium]